MCYFVNIQWNREGFAWFKYMHRSTRQLGWIFSVPWPGRTVERDRDQMMEIEVKLKVKSGQSLSYMHVYTWCYVGSLRSVVLQCDNTDGYCYWGGITRTDTLRVVRTLDLLRIGTNWHETIVDSKFTDWHYRNPWRLLHGQPPAKQLRVCLCSLIHRCCVYV